MFDIRRALTYALLVEFMFVRVLICGSFPFNLFRQGLFSCIGLSAR